MQNKKKNRTPYVYAVPPPPDIDLGHPIMSSKSSYAAKNGILGMVGFFGGELKDISRTTAYKQNSPESMPYDSGADMNQIGLKAEMKLNRGIDQMQTQMPQVQPQMMDESAMLLPDEMGEEEYYEEQVMQNQQRRVKNKQVDINRYIGLEPQKPQRVAGSFSDALEPLEEKAEIMCQILGKIYQTENMMLSLLRNLPQEISGVILENGGGYMEEPEEINEPMPDPYIAEPEAVAESSEPVEEEPVQEEEPVEAPKPRKTRKAKPQISEEDIEL